MNRLMMKCTVETRKISQGHQLVREAGLTVE